MTNPLTSLDELIWKQFEKVTVTANRRLGWDKWDLAKSTSALSAAAILGSGTYFNILGVKYKFIEQIIYASSMALFLGPLSYHQDLKMIKEKKN